MSRRRIRLAVWRPVPLVVWPTGVLQGPEHWRRFPPVTFPQRAGSRYQTPFFVCANAGVVASGGFAG